MARMLIGAAAGVCVRVVIAPDKLAGTYTAVRGCRRAAPGLGGRAPGRRGRGGAARRRRRGHGRGAPRRARRRVAPRTTVRDALGRPRRARFALLAGGEAALDVAEACGRQTVADLPPDPLGASSFGAGQLIAAAVAAGAARIIVGVGGTASTDGGAGLRAGARRRRRRVELVAALDVRNPLLGPDGAAAVFGPQKGASPAQVAVLERRLAALDLPTAALPGAGAGGGIGAMLMQLGARAVSGAELVAARRRARPRCSRARAVPHRRGPDRPRHAERQGRRDRGRQMRRRERQMHCDRRPRRPRGGGGARAARMRDLRARGHGGGRRALAARPWPPPDGGGLLGARRPRRPRRPARRPSARTGCRIRGRGRPAALPDRRAGAAPRRGHRHLAVAFTPDLPTGRLVFRLWPNGPLQAREGAHLTVAGVRLGGRPAATALPDPTTLVVRGGAPSPPAARCTSRCASGCACPGAVLDRLARVGTAVRLGSFFPLLPWEPGVGWATDPPTTLLAEASASPVADFAVRVRVPAGLGVIATGVPSAGGGWRARGCARLRGRGWTVPYRDRHGARAPARARGGRRCAGIAVSPGAVAAEVARDLGRSRAGSAPTRTPTCTSPSCRGRRPSGSSIRR